MKRSAIFLLFLSVTLHLPATIFVANNYAGQTISFNPGDTLRFLHICSSANDCSVSNGSGILWDSGYLGFSNTPVPGFVVDHVLTGAETSWSENEDDTPCGISGSLTSTATAVKETNTCGYYFQNPFADHLLIHLPALSRLRLYNACGDLFFDLSNARGEINLDTEHLLPGIYFLEVETVNDLVLQKLVK